MVKETEDLRSTQASAKEVYLYLIMSGKINTSPFDVSVPSRPSHIVKRVFVFRKIGIKKFISAKKNQKK